MAAISRYRLQQPRGSRRKAIGERRASRRLPPPSVPANFPRAGGEDENFNLVRFWPRPFVSRERSGPSPVLLRERLGEGSAIYAPKETRLHRLLSPFPRGKGLGVRLQRAT